MSFLTVGAQTTINAATGVVRMPFRRYLLAMLPGCAAWVLVWSTIGLSAFCAAIGAGVTSWWGATLVVLALGATGWYTARRVRER